MRVKRYVATLGATLALVSGSLIAAPTASAHIGGCSGTQIDHYWVRTSGGGTGGTLYGDIHLYYSSANGGTNCALLENVRYHGTAKDIFIQIGKSSGGSQSDHGSFAHYGGPVAVTGTSGTCIWLKSHMYNTSNASGTKAVRNIGNTHCG